MTLKRRFINECYNGDMGAYKKARKDDYYKVQFEWICWIDSLLKNGEITEKQWNNEVYMEI